MSRYNINAVLFHETQMAKDMGYLIKFIVLLFLDVPQGSIAKLVSNIFRARKMQP